VRCTVPLPIKPRRRNLDETAILVVSQPELRSELDSEHSQYQRRRTDGETEQEDGKKYFEELVKLGMAIGWILLVLVAITIVLSIFYRPFYITQIETESAEQQLDEKVKGIVTPHLKPGVSSSLVPENLPSIEFLSRHSEKLCSQQSPEENPNLLVARERAMSLRERANWVFVRLPEIDNSPVFDYSKPVVTPFARRRTGAVHPSKSGGITITFSEANAKKELKVSKCDKNWVSSSITAKELANPTVNANRATSNQDK